MAQRQTDDNVVRFTEAIVEGEQPPLVEPGSYDFGFMHHKTAYLFGRAPKLFCYFRIVSLGEYNGLVLCRHYNVKTLASKPRKGGSFKVGWRSDFLREHVTVLGTPLRLDRLSTAAFSNQIIRGRVATVETDHKGRKIPEPLRYSVIVELLEAVK